MLGTLFLTTADTSFISQTVIDGGASGTTVILDTGEDSTAVRAGLTIQKGSAENGGGGKDYFISTIFFDSAKSSVEIL